MFRVLFLGSFLLLLLLTPTLSHAMDPIVKCGFDKPCTACDFFTLVSNAMKWLVALITLVITLVVVWSGIRIATAGGNMGTVKEARSMFTNAVVGFAILLCTWLIIDTLMKTFLDQGKIGRPWNTISADACQTPAATAPTAPAGGGTGTPSGPYAGQVSQCPSSNPYCSVEVLIQAGFTQTQANVMSCIAMTESSGIPDTPPYSQTHPESNSTACGLFQVTKTTWNGTKSAVSGCQDFYGFCRSASCNTAISVQIVKQGGYSAWTCPGCNNKAQACVDTYGK